MVRINKVYTKVGDKGKTALVGGTKVAKDDVRIESYGTVDELNACLGFVISELEGSFSTKLAPILRRVQNELFNLGAELATPDPNRRQGQPVIAERHVVALEHEIDELNVDLPELTSFVLPGGGEVSARFHLARTVCRRAERRVVALSRQEEIGDLPVKYLNRLSDALFVFGRWAVYKSGQTEMLWEPEKT